MSSTQDRKPDPPPYQGADRREARGRFLGEERRKADAAQGKQPNPQESSQPPIPKHDDVH